MLLCLLVLLPFVVCLFVVTDAIVVFCEDDIDYNGNDDDDDDYNVVVDDDDDSDDDNNDDGDCNDNDGNFDDVHKD